MTPKTTSAVVGEAELAELCRPRQGVVAEQQLAPGDPGATSAWPGPAGRIDFVQGEGPFAEYRRSLSWSEQSPGRYRVEQSVDWRVGLAPFGWLVRLPIGPRIRRIGAEPAMSWWLPPVRLGRPAAVTLVTLCTMEIVVGYAANLLPYTMTYAGTSFHAGRTAQGVALGLSQLASVAALVLLVLADRRGRRRVLLWSLAAGAAISAGASLAPALWALTAAQSVAQAFGSVCVVLIGVLAAEEMPAGARAWALGVIGMCFGLGSGIALAALPLAETGTGGWRWIYATGLLAVPAAVACGLRLPPQAGAGGHPVITAAEATPPARGLAVEVRGGEGNGPPAAPGFARALLLLGAGAFLLALFVAPGGGLQNQYLRSERHLSPLAISILLQVTGTIGGLGTLAGGRLADTRGRRPVAAAGIAALTVSTLAVYFSRGAGLWGSETVSSAASYAIVPALSVYGVELFPAAVRGRAGGVLTVLAAAGGLIGLASAGALSDAIGTTGPALAVLAGGPVAVVALILLAFPETASVPLAVLHPGDALAPGGGA